MCCAHIFQTHPNIDKKAFTSNSVIALKAADKTYPLNTETAVLKWRVQGSDESSIPLTGLSFALMLHLETYLSELLAHCQWPVV
jgi:hypothetical protein